MNLKGIGRLLAAFACLGMLVAATGCNTTKGSKGKCPTCPEWSTPSQPPR
ncbi:MAG: hypothetical protein O2990_08150 [Bacteroidetes bacterium]|nr:hypothetical protein [Bacteroidota bacterium]